MEKYSIIELRYDMLTKQYFPSYRSEFDKNNKKVGWFPRDEKCSPPNPFDSFKCQFSIYNII